MYRFPFGNIVSFFQANAIGNSNLQRTDRGDFISSTPTSSEVVTRFNLIENKINRFTAPNCS